MAAKPTKAHLAAVGNAWIMGLALALAEVHRRGGGSVLSDDVRAVVKEAGLDLKKIKAAGVDPFDWKELKRAGVK